VVISAPLNSNFGHQFYIKQGNWEPEITQNGKIVTVSIERNGMPKESPK
jgi:hypothetical protein